jgi:hypothetical protein
MISILKAEILKLRRSLVLLVIATPPVMVLGLYTLIMVSGNGAPDWELYLISSAAIWAFFLLPMSIIGITALLAQIEHTPSTWSHVLALPTPRWQIFTGKALIALSLNLFVAIAVALGAVAAGLIGAAITPEHAMGGEIPWRVLAETFGKMFLASTLLTAVQWTIATHSKSFALPVSIGIGGTFVAVAATSSKYGLYFPWLMPTNVLASDPERALLAIQLGGYGGLIAFALAIWSLSRRDWD